MKTTKLVEAGATITLIMLLAIGPNVLGKKDSLSGTVENLRTGEIYQKIEYAISDPDTLDGDILYVHEATYRERVDIDKSIRLIGENKETTIITYGDPEFYTMGISANGVTVTGFTIINSGCELGNYGLVISSSDNIVTNNNFFFADSGIVLGGSHNMIKGNTIANNDDGIVVNGNNNVIAENTIKDNLLGIAVYNSDNQIYHNNFINRQISSNGRIHKMNAVVLFTGGINQWDNGYPSGGNYWSDYQGYDRNSDGIGDTPYVIFSYTLWSGKNVDRFPLMEPFQ